MKRILVIGPGGAGKSTFAVKLGAVLGIDVIHLDQLYWRPGWVEPPKEVWAETVESVLRREAWVMDGNYSGTLERRLAACDAVIFLDLPRTTCMLRVVRRGATWRGRTRPDMASGCPERLSAEFLLWIWNYGNRTRPNIERLLAQKGAGTIVVRLRSQTEVDAYLESHRRETPNEST